LGVAGLLVVVVFVGVALVTRAQAIDTVTLLPEERPALRETPEDYGMTSETVTVTTEDGLVLYGWYIPGTNGATVMYEHGSPGGRQDGLFEAEFLHRHGYNVLMGSFRAHDESDGELVSFGYREVNDIAAWHQYLLSRDDVDPTRIAILGESMGGGTGILYTAAHENVRAMVAVSAFALTQETVETFIEYEQGTPTWLTPVLAGFFVFWGERAADFDSEALNTDVVVGQISPRPLLIIHGGSEDKIDPENGQQLYDAAGEPKEFWFVPEAGHVNFDKVRPTEYEARVTDFLDRYLLAAE
jgi:dipeptidyl aminopeptidase/acylaminoacyl peptidase